MSHNKGFLGHLFSRGDQRSDETSSVLTLSQRVELQNTLKSEYGIEILHTDLTRTDLMQNGYRKMASDELAQASMVLQYVPQFVALAANNQAVDTAFKAATAGTFRISLADGLHLAASKLTPGAYRGIGLSNATNQVAGSAELIKNNAALTIPQAPQIALGVFSALSLATGQYFMTQINGKLETITDGIDRIEQFLENSRRSELTAACQELNEQTARIEYIGSEHDASEIITHLNNIRLAVRKHIPHYQAQIQALTADMQEKDKAEDIDKKIQIVATYLQEYRYAVQIVAMTKMLELRIKNVMDPDQMAMYRQEIAECIELYKADYLSGEQSCKAYLDHSRVLNKRSIVQNVATAATFTAEVLVSPVEKITGRTIISRSVNDSFESHRTKRKEHSIQVADVLFGCIGSIDELDSPVNAIDGFIEALKEHIEIVCIDGDYFTNLPCGEAE